MERDNEPPSADEAAWQADAERLAAVAAGDEAAFAALFHERYERVFRVANGVLRDVEEAREVVQEVFLRLHQVAPRWEPRARLDTWLYRVTVHRSLSVRRRFGRFARASLQPLMGPGPERQAASREAVQALRRGLLLLSPKQRAVVVLHLECGLTPSEIAADVGMTPNAARVTLHRALEKLRAAIGLLELPDEPAMAPRALLEESPP